MYLVQCTALTVCSQTATFRPRMLGPGNLRPLPRNICTGPSHRMGRRLPRLRGSEWSRMVSVLVCHSYFLRFDQKQVERAKPYPPLATLQVASMLRHAGHEVSLFDAMLADDLSRFERQLDVLKPQVVLLYE